MKSLIQLLFLLSLSAALSAQVVQVKSVQRVAVPDTVAHQTGKVAGIEPDGRHILLTDPANRGLYRYTVLTKRAKRLSAEDGAGYRVHVEKKGLRTLYTNDYATAAHRAPRVAESDPQPLGPGQGYLWTSYSPSGEKYLFYVSGYGAFVCQRDGSELQRIGALRAARWLTEDIIIAMDDEDDGEVVTASTIVAYDLRNGKRQALTDAALKMMYPYADSRGKKIACSSDDGNIYLITLR